MLSLPLKKSRGVITSSSADVLRCPLSCPGVVNTDFMRGGVETIRKAALEAGIATEEREEFQYPCRGDAIDQRAFFSTALAPCQIFTCDGEGGREKARNGANPHARVDDISVENHIPENAETCIKANAVAAEGFRFVEGAELSFRL